MVAESLMQCMFQSGSVLGVAHSVDIEWKWHGGTAQLIHSFLRVQPACKPDFVDPFAKRADVRDDIHKPSTCLLRHTFCSDAALLRLLELFLKNVDFRH
ncbi:hypothetical protein SDC9_104552 [bioreactor metagenome]|uniref:Uncharacterized protein n=1 Tax=bioreactor metagenome TaxID=1076179 RepID=A0A645AXA9_9ZZZZ